MLNRLITDTELAQIMPHHLRLNFHLIELLSRVDPHYAPNHLGYNDHVAEMRLDQIGFLVGLGFLLCFAEFFDEAHGTTLEAAVEAAAGAGVEEG
jgi:hypothetical protein